jgi:hypothetical protein
MYPSIHESFFANLVRLNLVRLLELQTFGFDVSCIQLEKVLSAALSFIATFL